jgi:hypothetical protein
MIAAEYDGVTAPPRSYMPRTIGALVRAGFVTAERKAWCHDMETGKWSLLPLSADSARVPDATTWRITDAGRAAAA